MTTSWNTTLSSNGPQHLTAVAADAAGNVGTSADVTVTVANPLSSSVLDDNFNDNSINASLWNTVIVPAGAGTISETNQRLEMIRLIPGAAYQGLQGRCKVRGDFDVQVDFTLLNWPLPENFNALRLAAMDLPQGPGGLQGVMRISYSNEVYQMRAVGGITSVDRTDFSGKLRLTRTGSTLQGYYWDGTAFVLLGSSPTSMDDTKFLVDFSSPDGPVVSPAGVTIAIDNFKVALGTAVCP